MRNLVLTAVWVCSTVLAGCGGGSDVPDGYSIDKGWVTSPSGLKTLIIQMGTGPRATSYKSVSVIYKGWLDDGTVFDSNQDPSKPFTFTIGAGQVIAGWDQGLLNMPSRTVLELIIPPSLGYGDRAQGTIPANSTLHFWIEIISVQ